MGQGTSSPPHAMRFRVSSRLTGGRLPPHGRFKNASGARPCSISTNSSPTAKALREGEPTRATDEVVKRAVADPAAVIAALGEPRFGGVDRLYNDADLTILNLRWYPGQDLLPHNHNMWAVIGLFSGREDNTFGARAGPGGQARR